MSREEDHIKRKELKEDIIDIIIKRKELTEDIIDIINEKNADEELCVSSMCVVLAQIIDKSDNSLITYNSVLEYLSFLIKKRIGKTGSSQSELKHY